MTTSIIDYIFRELAVTYLGRYDLAHIGEDTIQTGSIDSLQQKEDEADFDEEKLYSERIIEEKIVPHKEETTTVKKEVEEEPLHIQVKNTGADDSKKGVSSKRRMVDEARMKGYTGDICPQCGQSTMVRNGTCLKCVTCGTTTGCS